MLGKGQEVVGGFRVNLFAGFVDNIQVLKNSTLCLLLHVATIFCWKVVVHGCSSLYLRTNGRLLWIKLPTSVPRWCGKIAPVDREAR